MRKIYPHLVISMTFLSLIVPGASALAEPPQPTVSPEPVVTSEAVSAAAIPESPVADQAALKLGTNTLIDPVTSVSQLSNVQPGDWTFRTLQSLIEQYGVTADYPHITYWGNRAMTRSEFAVHLNAVLQQVNELIAVGLTTRVSRDDLVTLKRLQQEFAVELATLQGRIDTLETRAAELEANQFSTTTKISGLVVIALSGGGFTGDRIIDSRGVEIANENPNAALAYRATLDFDTSFSGTDQLRIRAESGSARHRDNAGGFLEPNFGSSIDFSYRSAVDEMFAVTQLSYTFTPFKNFTVTLAPAVDIAAFVDKNNYANPSALNVSTNALTNTYILFPLPPGASAVIEWNPDQGPFKVRGVYLTADADNPVSDNRGSISPATPLATLLYPNGGGNRGLFGDPNQGVVELEYVPSKTFALRLQYSRGTVFEGRFEVFGANFELALSDRLAVFGRYGSGSYDDTAFGDINPKYWMAGVEFQNLFAVGALAGVAAGQPFIDSAVGNATQTNIEVFYNFPLNDHIRITPFIQVIVNAGNQNSNGTIITGNLRTVFSF